MIMFKHYEPEMEFEPRYLPLSVNAACNKKPKSDEGLIEYLNSVCVKILNTKTA